MPRVIQIDMTPYDVTGEGDWSSASTRSGEAGGREWVNESTEISLACSKQADGSRESTDCQGDERSDDDDDNDGDDDEENDHDSKNLKGLGYGG